MSQAVARQMVKQRAGVIVNVSSESGPEGSEGQSCYAATKAALNSFTAPGPKNWVNMGSAWSALRRGSSKTGLRTPEYEEALARRAISPSSNFARDIPKRHSHRAGRKALGSG